MSTQKSGWLDRNATLQRLRSQEHLWDFVIIGGGATGSTLR